jgi:hypothetical protein
MRNKEQQSDLSVQGIAGTHVVLLGIDFPEQKCPGLLGFALRRDDPTLATASNPGSAATLPVRLFDVRFFTTESTKRHEGGSKRVTLCSLYPLSLDCRVRDRKVFSYPGT